MSLRAQSAAQERFILEFARKGYREADRIQGHRDLPAFVLTLRSDRLNNVDQAKAVA